ncbi:hydrogenase small subunit [Desulfotalea psychrophila]|uniref:Related to periplasmic [NiFeSe] hydrogenase, small subunit [Precursor] n=1 Tax=Desulfotalea psychrophila (strain LSv54 / DSM 12343) TaxID=177439 RepID=Q6ARY6_DESPS|nr:hydrogenase small subunit [Desulfotalea psychrophila]CAG34889.1 related to periplasmic [NiFeSe] hydrogenase, small subunit [Precursor] [Desulfotalea psychrophila LSv54]
MTTLTRRQFLELSAKMSVVLGLGSSAIPQVAEALEALTTGRSKVLWLQAQSCSGCSISMLDSESPGPAELLTQYISLLFHHTLSAATGESCMHIVRKSVQQGGYILVVEGSIPAGMPEACMMGGIPVGELIKQAAERADYVIALGTCAAFGGIPAAEGNPTGAVPLGPFLQANKIKTPIINIPGCPSHPDWLVGTLVHLCKFGLPPCDEQRRPKMFFASKNHDKCPRFSDYEQENFARKFSDPGCLFKLGCLGVSTYADCTIRDRNGGTNACIKAGAPCIGCSSPQFAQKKSLPFYRKSE